MNKVHVKISGQVQGVGYRYWVKQQFKELGLSGEAWNNPDGTVEAEFNGGDGAVGTLTARLYQGPPLARVKKVDILEEDKE